MASTQTTKPAAKSTKATKTKAIAKLSAEKNEATLKKSKSTAAKTPAQEAPAAIPVLMVPPEALLAAAVKMPILQSAPAPEEITEEQRAAEEAAEQTIAKSQNSMAFAVAQLSKPANAQPIVTPVDENKLAFEKEMKALAEKYNQPVPTVRVPRGTVTKDMQNGYTRPGANTTCGKIWAAADEITQNAGTTTIAALKEHSACRGVNPHTVKTQYARWRAYNGITGRTA